MCPYVVITLCVAVQEGTFKLQKSLTLFNLFFFQFIKFPGKSVCSILNYAMEKSSPKE